MITNENTKNIKYKIVEIFTSIDGEGARTGLPCTFIRIHTCNLHCSYCDSRYACEGEDYKEMYLDEIVEVVENNRIPAVTITGGEPLLHDNVYHLIETLAKRSYCINIETNGSIDLSRLDYLRYRLGDFGNIMITMDWKCESSGMSSYMKESNFQYLNKYDVLKFVVGNHEDLTQMKHILSSYLILAQIFVSPVFGEIEPKEIVEYLLAHELYDVKTQVQLHKILWPADMRGV